MDIYRASIIAQKIKAGWSVFGKAWEKLAMCLKRKVCCTYSVYGLEMETNN